MKYGNLVIEQKEYVVLKRTLNISLFGHDITLRKSVGKLSKEMQSAIIFDEKEMPEDVVRFNSTLTISTKNGWFKTIQLVLPKDSDIRNNKISLLTPMGAAIMGYAEGDTLVWEFPSGYQELLIEKVIQEKNNLILEMLL